MPFRIAVVRNLQIFSKGEKRAVKATRRVKNSHRYNHLRHLDFFPLSVVSVFRISSHVKNSSYAHANLKICLSPGIALMEMRLELKRDTKTQNAPLMKLYPLYFLTKANQIFYQSILRQFNESQTLNCTKSFTRYTK